MGLLFQCKANSKAATMRNVQLLLLVALSVFTPLVTGDEKARAVDEPTRQEVRAKALSRLNAALGNTAGSEASYPDADPNMECMIGPTSIPVRSLLRQVSQLDSNGEQVRLYFRPGADGKIPPPVAVGKEWLAFDIPGRSGQQAFLRLERGGHYLTGKTIHFMSMDDGVICAEQRAGLGPFDNGTTEITHQAKTASTGECGVGETLQNTNYGAVLNTFCANRLDFDRVYRRMSRRAPDAQGEITFWLSVSEYGEVEDVRVVQSTMDNREFEFRVLLLLRRLDFGRLETGGWAGRQTLRFPQ